MIFFTGDIHNLDAHDLEGAVSLQTGSDERRPTDRHGTVRRDTQELLVVAPDTSVAELIQAVQAARAEGRTPIIMIDAPPATAERIVDRLPEAILRPSPMDVEHLDFDGLEIDVPARSVFVDGECRELTAREFDLLVVMARRPRRVFTRDELMSLVWGYTDYVDQNAVRVVVCRIRDKIERDPAHPHFIATVRGVGYRFQPAATTPA